MQTSAPTQARSKFYNYYTEGNEFMEEGDWERALEAYKASASLEWEDTKKKRIYGTRFIKYFPHRQIGIAYFQLKEYHKAKEELSLSLAYKESKEAKKFLQKVEEALAPKEPPPELTEEELRAIEAEEAQLAEAEAQLTRERERIDQLAEKSQELAREAETKQLAKEREEMAKLKAQLAEAQKKEEQRLQKMMADMEKQQEKLRREKEQLRKERKKSKKERLPAGALTYDPEKVVQVGSRLSVAVLKFEERGSSAAEIGESLSEQLEIELVNLRRFKVVERRRMKAILNEQKLSLTGIIDDSKAIEMGKVLGVDVIALGSVNIDNEALLNVRLVDTETGEIIVAKSAQNSEKDLSHLSESVQSLAVKIYNDLPLVEGEIIFIDDEDIYLDIGTSVGIRKGTKFVAFVDGQQFKHPKTGEVLHTKAKYIGELVVSDVQETSATGRLLEDEDSEEIEVGFKVVVK